MKLILVATALSAVSYAQIDMVKITDCSGLFDDCRIGPDANMATCAAANAQCEQCQIDYNQCRAPGNGVSKISRILRLTEYKRLVLIFSPRFIGLWQPGWLRSPSSKLCRLGLPPAEG